ncbi:MAG: membrane protein insertion efficiency factor YidD [Patescibacteria group bacterium]
MSSWINVLKKAPRTCGTLLIWCYQRILSPDHGFPRFFIGPAIGCRFYPTCSQYAKESIKRLGLWDGGIRAVRRLLRCNPWATGGYDPPDFSL